MTEHVPEHRGTPADETDPARDTPKALLTGKTYDFVKRLAMIYLPAFGALYFGLAGIWGLPNAEAVVGTIVVVDTFLGGILQVSIAQYNASPARFDGKIAVETNVEEGFTNVHLSVPSENVIGKDEVLLKVEKS